MKVNFTIGTDAEFFLLRNENPISAIPFIGNEEVGTKHNPIRTKCGATVQRDNVAVEFATRPAKTLNGFIRSIKDGFREAIKVINSSEERRRYNSNDVFSLSDKSAVIFDPSELHHWEAQQFGCEPDYNAWDLVENPSPRSKNPCLRTAGGHVHIGSPMLKDPINKLRMIRIMDVYLGIPSIDFDSSPESKMRRELYGKAGAHRPTHYGVEYRVLSNKWLTDPKLIKFVYESVRYCLSLLYYGDDFYRWGAKFPREYIQWKANIPDIINSGSSIAAKKFLKKLTDRIGIN